MKLNELEKVIRDNEIHTVEIGFTDIPGVLRGKRIPAQHFLKTAEKGFALSKGVLAWDIQCEVFPGIEIANFGNGFLDMIAKPDLATFRIIPWRKGNALVLCDLYYEDGNLVEVAPRQILRRQVEKANSLGFRPLLGAELEFYLLTENLEPVYQGIQCYSLFKGSQLEFILEEIRLALDHFEIKVEASNTEYGPGQVEINLHYDDALTMADNTVLFKYIVKDIARKHGHYATFMPKPWTEDSGNGFHIHQSLWDLELKENLFAKNQALAENYLSGLLLTTRDFMAIGSPSINSYKRLRDHSFAPINVTWGYDNRTVAIRTLLGHGAGSRIEHRTGSADANPYFIFAANIASGLYGIEQQLIPSGVTDENAYLTDAPLLPTNLRDALFFLSKNELAKQFFGEDFVNLYLTMGWHEVSLFETTVTEWERARYLEMA